MSAISKWLSALLGRPVSKSAQSEGEVKQSEQQSKSQPQLHPSVQQESKPASPGTTEMSEDSVASDLAKLKRMIGKFTGSLGVSVKSKIPKARPTVAAGRSGGDKVPFHLIKKILRPVIIVVILLVIVLTGASLFQKISKRNGDGEQQPVVEVTATPTSVPFKPFRPSAYAEDEGVLKMEEDINVLEQEVSGTILKENNLNPPSLDFNISF